jgi:multiple sugar transport system ATP-binding protein
VASLELKGVRKAFGSTPVLDDVSVTLESREFIAFLGPSGSGKSTLLRIIAGLETADAGEVWLEGRRIDRLPPGERGVAMVFQHYALYPHMSVRENMAFGLKNARVSKDEIERRIVDAAQVLEIDPLLERKPGQLSGGQRQRVAIARVLLKDAPILILDEATSALDSEVEAAIQEQLVNLMKGKTVIAIAHRLSTIAALDRLVVIDRGRIVEEGSHAELLRSSGLYARLWSRQSGGFLGASQESSAA